MKIFIVGEGGCGDCSQITPKAAFSTKDKAAECLEKSGLIGEFLEVELDPEIKPQWLLFMERVSPQGDRHSFTIKQNGFEDFKPSLTASNYVDGYGRSKDEAIQNMSMALNGLIRAWFSTYHIFRKTLDSMLVFIPEIERDNAKPNPVNPHEIIAFGETKEQAEHCVRDDSLIRFMLQQDFENRRQK